MATSPSVYTKLAQNRQHDKDNKRKTNNKTAENAKEVRHATSKKDEVISLNHVWSHLDSGGVSVGGISRMLRQICVDRGGATSVYRYAKSDM